MGLNIPGDAAASFNTVNQTLTVEGTGALNGKSVVLFLAPLAQEQRQMAGDIPSSDYGALRASYQALFEEATVKGLKSISIPCFSTGAGRLDSEEAARIAVDEAITYTNDHSELKVDFVPFEGDTVSIHAYASELAGRIGKDETSLSKVSIHPGRIEEARGAALVCPVREQLNFSNSGVTAKTIQEAANQEKGVKTYSGIRQLAKTQTQNMEQGSLTIQQGDITKSDADFIVNAANSEFIAGGGVCGSIYRAAGKDLLDLECLDVLKEQGPPQTGEARLTGAAMMESTNGTKGIIHAVGPDMRTPIRKKEAREKLASAYKSSLKLARGRGAKSIAFPSISTGIYGFPPKEASVVFMQTVKEFFEDNPGLEMDVRMVLFDDNDFATYQTTFTALQKDKPEIPDHKLLNKAVAQQDPRFFVRNASMITVDSELPLKADKVMFYAAPIAADLMAGRLWKSVSKEKLVESYMDLFAEALEQRSSSVMSIAIPTFSIGKGGVDANLAADAALTAALQFVSKPENRGKLNIVFVPYHQDQHVIAAYRKEFADKFKGQGEKYGVDVAPGLLECQKVDAIVVPMPNSLDPNNGYGPTARSVLNAVSNNELPVDPGVPTFNQEIAKAREDQEVRRMGGIQADE